MKKIFCLVFAIIILFASVSCSQKSNHVENSVPDETNLNFKYDQNSKYMTFEQLVATATDIIKGRCVGVDRKDGYAEYEFSVISRYLGEEVEGNIFVYVPDYAVTVINTDYSYRLFDLSYQKGSEYYLVLLRYVDVYLPHDRYINVGGNLFMPANDISHSTLYKEPIINHSQIESINAEKDLTGYLSKITNNTTDKTQANAVQGIPYITDTDTDSIIDKSDFILKVKIGEEVYKGIANDRCTYDCVVIRSMKGSVNSNELVRIVFPKGAVIEGNEYILALTEFKGVSPRSFVMSSKNSIYELPSLEYIEKHLTNK